MMNSEIKAKWIAALRSGKYQQGREALRREGEDGVCSFCCLGVLLDIAPPEAGQWDGEDFLYKEPWNGYSKEQGDLWRATANYYGISNQTQLVTMNDGLVDGSPVAEHSKSFPEIADYIEANL